MCWIRIIGAVVPAVRLAWIFGCRVTGLEPVASKADRMAPRGHVQPVSGNCRRVPAQGVEGL